MDKQAAESRIAAIEKEAAELRKLIEDKSGPKLRHWDYGFCDEDGCFICIQSNIRSKLEYSNDFGLVQADDVLNPIILGNLGEDLKRNAVDLEWFERDRVGFNNYVVRINSTRDVCIETEGAMCCLGKDEVTRFHQLFGQLRATLRRKNAGETL